MYVCIMGDCLLMLTRRVHFTVHSFGFVFLFSLRLCCYSLISISTRRSCQVLFFDALYYLLYFCFCFCFCSCFFCLCSRTPGMMSSHTSLLTNLLFFVNLFPEIEWECSLSFRLSLSFCVRSPWSPFLSFVSTPPTLIVSYKPILLTDFPSSDSFLLYLDAFLSTLSTSACL